MRLPLARIDPIFETAGGCAGERTTPAEQARRPLPNSLPVLSAAFGNGLCRVLTQILYRSCYQQRFLIKGWLFAPGLQPPHAGAQDMLHPALTYEAFPCYIAYTFDEECMSYTASATHACLPKPARPRTT